MWFSAPCLLDKMGTSKFFRSAISKNRPIFWIPFQAADLKCFDLFSDLSVQNQTYFGDCWGDCHEGSVGKGCMSLLCVQLVQELGLDFSGALRRCGNA